MAAKLLDFAPQQRVRVVGAATWALRVLHLINGEHYSGAERVQDLLALRLPEFGCEVSFACVKPGRFATSRLAQETPLVNLPMRSRFDLRCVLTLKQLIRQERYDLLHTHTPRTALVGGLAALLADVPMLYHLHSPTVRETTHRWRNCVNVATERLSLLWAARVIAVSHSLGDYARRQGVPPERVSIVPNGVPQMPLVPRSCPMTQWTLGTVALFRPRKGIEVLLDALALLKARGRPVRLRAVGGFETDKYATEVKSYVAKLGLEQEVEWVGFTRDVAGELVRMDLFVLPSLFGEGLPMVVLEAMAAGVPVIGTRVEGVPEAIRCDLEGLLAEPGDSGDLALQIERMLDEPHLWPRFRENAHRRQWGEFSDRSLAAGVAEVYREVLDR